MTYEYFKEKCKKLSNDIWDIVRDNPTVFKANFEPAGLETMMVTLDAFKSYLPDHAEIHDSLTIIHYDDLKNIYNLKFNIGRYEYDAMFYPSTNNIICTKAKYFYSGMYNDLESEYRKEIKTETFIRNLEKFKTKIHDYLEKIKKLRPELLESAEA